MLFREISEHKCDVATAAGCALSRTRSAPIRRALPPSLDGNWGDTVSEAHDTTVVPNFRPPPKRTYNRRRHHASVRGIQRATCLCGDTRVVVADHPSASRRATAHTCRLRSLGVGTEQRVRGLQVLRQRRPGKRRVSWLGRIGGRELLRRSSFFQARYDSSGPQLHPVSRLWSFLDHPQRLQWNRTHHRPRVRRALWHVRHHLVSRPSVFERRLR